MKKAIVTILTALVSQTAFAGDLYCGANVEKVKGSEQYDQSLFLEKVDASKPFIAYLLADGTVLRQQDITLETLAKVKNGDLVLGVSFNEEGKPTLFSGKVKREKQNTLKYKNTAITVSFDSKNVMLVANRASLYCKEM